MCGFVKEDATDEAGEQSLGYVITESTGIMCKFVLLNEAIYSSFWYLASKTVRDCECKLGHELKMPRLSDTLDFPE